MIMGSGKFVPKDWDNFRTTHVKVDNHTKSAAQTFSKTAKSEFDPKNIVSRLSCETKEKPQVTPIIIALDVTGSMGKIPEALIKGGLGTLMAQILARESIPNPHIMFMAVGDVNCDQSPLQVTQFEADIRIAAQLKDLFLEGGGGGNGSESYPLAWHFAATKTELDCLKNRKEKGILFTIGDDNAPQKISGKHITQFTGQLHAQDSSTVNILQYTQSMYDVFHLGIKESEIFTQAVENGWKNLLGERAIVVHDYTKVAEVIVSTIDMLCQQRTKKVAESTQMTHLWNSTAPPSYDQLVNDGSIVNNAVNAVSMDLSRDTSNSSSSSKPV